MPFDPISYSLAKKSVINSTSPPYIGKFWYDVNRGVLRGYSFKNGEWRFLSMYKYDDFDNPGYGGWDWNIQIPISTSPSESVQYCVEINGDNIYVKSNDLTKNLVTGTGGTTFWQNVGGINDIRVFDENFIQNYFWIEEFDTANQVAKIWVKLNAGQTVIGIAFGNPYAGVSEYHSGDMTFEFFDDFDGDTVDTNKWSVTTYGDGSISVSNSVINNTATGGCAIITNTTGVNVDKFYCKIRYKIGTNSATPRDRFRVSTSDNNFLSGGDYGIFDNYYYYWVSGLTNVSASTGVFMNMYHIYDGSTYTWKTVKDDGTIEYSNQNSISATPPFSFLIGVGDGNSTAYGGNIFVDYIFVRKYISTDLTFGTPKIDIF